METNIRNKCKAYTSLEQSKTLAEILPIESADMYYFLDPTPAGNIYHIVTPQIDFGVKTREPEYDEGDIPAWSLAALLNYLREIDFFPEIEADEHGVTMSINYYDEEEARLLAPVHNIKVKAESFIDACVAMIEKLHEQNIL